MSGLQPANECGIGDVLTTVVYFGHMALKIADVVLEALALPHVDGQEVVDVPLELIARGVLSVKRPADFLKVMK